VKPVRVEPEAKQELAAAAGWYEEQREGLGLELLAEVDAVFTAIARAPSRFPLYPRVANELGVRRAAARRFPYSIAFIELPNVVRVVAVAHERRRPGYWVGRVKGG
jgi:plasmid stabilization system protein ParE